MSPSSSCSPCLHVGPKIRQQRIGRDESIGLFSIADMPVVALGGFVVVTEHAHTVDDESKSILVFVARTANHTRHAPDHRSEEHTSELQSQSNLVCRLLLE